MPKVGSFGGFSLFYRLWALAHIPSQKQKSIRNPCTFGARQFKPNRFSLKQGIKSKPYCRMARFLTQVQRKDTVLNHIGFGFPHLQEKTSLVGASPMKGSSFYPMVNIMPFSAGHRAYD